MSKNLHNLLISNAMLGLLAGSVVLAACSGKADGDPEPAAEPAPAAEEAAPAEEADAKSVEASAEGEQPAR